MLRTTPLDHQFVWHRHLMIRLTYGVLLDNVEAGERNLERIYWVVVPFLLM